MCISRQQRQRKSKVGHGRCEFMFKLTHMHTHTHTHTNTPAHTLKDTQHIKMAENCGTASGCVAAENYLCIRCDACYNETLKANNVPNVIVSYTYPKELTASSLTTNHVLSTERD